MFSSRNGLEYKYDFTANKFRIAFEFLKRKDLADLPVGWIELGEGVRASVQRYTSFKWDENRSKRRSRPCSATSRHIPSRNARSRAPVPPWRAKF